ncbi:Protein TASOR [Dirofilaria immitis]
MIDQKCLVHKVVPNRFEAVSGIFPGPNFIYIGLSILEEIIRPQRKNLAAEIALFTCSLNVEDFVSTVLYCALKYMTFRRKPWFYHIVILCILWYIVWLVAVVICCILLLYDSNRWYCGTMQRNDFSIPRKPLDQTGVPQHYVSDIALNCEAFRNIYQQVILSHLSNNCQDRESIRIARCRIISNKQLETRFSNFRRSLESQWLPADVSFGYTLLSDNLRETELIAQWGLSVNNNFVGDLGEPTNGVYLSEHPDLVTPAPFLGRIKLKILACKILKGRCNIVGLGSYHLMPRRGYHSHIALQPVDCKLSRHDNYRCDQIFLFEEKRTGYSKSPANILPFAIYDVEFPPNTVLSFKGTDSIVWSGNLLVGSKLYSRISLCSLAAATKPPLLDTFEIADLIHWTACMAFPPVLELLKPPALGEIALKKEVLLIDSQRLVYYFTLFSEDDSHDLILLHESMRIKQAAGITIFPSVGIFILLPNGLFSDLLMLPKTTGTIFHCLYVTSDLNCSLISGAFEAMSMDENDEFMRPLLLQERIDGLDVRVQELIRNVAKKISFSEENSNKSRIQGEILNASSEAIDMDIADSDDDEEKRGWGDGRMGTMCGMEKHSRKHPSSPHSVDETVSYIRLLSSDPRREKVSRDPRKRLINSQNLPIPSCSVLGRKIPDRSPLRKHLDAKKKSLTSSFDLTVTDFHGYSPSDAISSGESSPKALSQSQKSPPNIFPNSKGNNNTVLVGSFLKKQNELPSTESPASPPHEAGVFVATAPKIISDYDMRSATDASFQTSIRQYRPPEVTSFTILASMEAMKNPGSLIDKKQESKIDCGGVYSKSTSQNNENHVINDESSYILPELISFPHDSIRRNSAENKKSDSSLNCSSHHLRWDISPSSKVDGRDLFWKTKTGSIGSSDVDMRTIHTISSVPNISPEVTTLTTHHVTSVIQAPIVFSNGDTDHRNISSTVRPSTSAQPPECFTNESTGRFRKHAFSSFTPPPSAGAFQYHNASSTNYITRFKQPCVYGFFNQPVIHHQPKPYYARDTVSGNSSTYLQKRGILMIDDAQIMVGAIDPKFLRMILERFSNWRKNGSVLWWIKLHGHLRQTFRLDSVSSNSNPKIVEKYAHYEEIIKEYENLKVIQTMKPHECDRNKHDVNTLLKCLSHTRNMNRKCSMIYLTDIAKDSSIGKQIAHTGGSVIHFLYVVSHMRTDVINKFYFTFIRVTSVGHSLACIAYFRNSRMALLEKQVLTND